ncbi:MAG TPA: hypothetical protein VJP86_15005 [Vicinamibacterales bacterium]|jgi:hypothetical protein|nr:hypothetical protein [Vicinamibacterales bacterium]
MLKSLGALCVGAIAAFTVTSFAAPASQDRPGIVSQPQVRIVNRGQSEAIPVAIAGWPDRPSVQISGPVTLSESSIAQIRQSHQWQYRTVAVPADQDAAAVLNQLGSGGWEAVSFAIRPAGDAIVLLKKPSS